MIQSTRVAIIGGGVGGLAAALAMFLKGLDVAVFEQVRTRAESGTGLQLGPNGMKVLRALGLEERILELGCRIDNQYTRDWRSGRIISSMPRDQAFLDRFGAPHCGIHRADLVELLVEDVPGRLVHPMARCIATTSTESYARARFDDGDEIEADVVVGADGVHSAVRADLSGPDEPHFAGRICWRGLVPADIVPKEIAVSDGTLWVGPNGRVAHHFVRRGAWLSFVAVHDSVTPIEESWTGEGEREELIAAFAGWHNTVLRLFACAEHCYKSALQEREPLTRWSKGRVTLLGDAAHPLPPSSGQGAGLAIEDGYVLAEMIASLPDDLDDALRGYARLRIPRARRAMLESRPAPEIPMTASPWARMMRALRRRSQHGQGDDEAGTGAFWLYDYDAPAKMRFPLPE